MRLLGPEILSVTSLFNEFTSSNNPQSEPAEQANRQVLEALRAAVATVVQYDEWDVALPHVTFGLIIT